MKRQPPADLAHLVERDLAKVEVAGSSPVIRSIETRSAERVFCFYYEDFLIWCKNLNEEKTDFDEFVNFSQSWLTDTRE